MNKHELARAVLYQIEGFFLLQEIDYLVAHEEQLIAPVLNKIYAQRSLSWGLNGFFPLIGSSAAMCMLFLPISYIAGHTDEELNELGLEIKNQYKFIYKEDGIDVSPTTKKVLKTIRNALAHISDFSSHNKQSESDASITFDQGVIRFRSKRDEFLRRTKANKKIKKEIICTLVFDTQEGFILFLGDVIKATKKLTSSRLL
jgi:hypothetical protein